MKTPENQRLGSPNPQTPSAPVSPVQSGVGASAAWVGLGTLISRVLGFIRDMMMAAYFSRTVTDAWTVAFRLPNMFRRLLGEGALSVSFIPVFVELLKPGSSTAQEQDPAKRLASAVFTLLLSVTLVLTALGILFAEPIVRVLAGGEGFAAIPGKLEMTVRFARIMFVYVLLVCVYAYFMAILNSLKEFWLPAFAPALWNVSMIGAAFVPIPGAHESGEVLAWAVVVGGCLQLGVLIPALAKRGYFPKLNFDFSGPHLKQVFKALGPSMIGLSVMQVTILVNTHFASRLPEGANSWIFWADRLLELPLSLFAVSLGTALLPTLSAQWSQGQRQLFSETTSYYLRAVFFLSIPAAIGTYLLAEPIVRVLFERGRFTAYDTQMTALVLQVYAFSILTASGVRILAPSFYAIKNVKFPMICSLVALVVHVALAGFAVERFGLTGLVASTALSAAVNLFLLLVGFSFFVGSLEYKKLLWGLLRFGFAGGLMAGFLQVQPLLQQAFGVDWWGQALTLACLIIGAIAVYFGASAAMGFEEMRPLVQKVRRRLRRG